MPTPRRTDEAKLAIKARIEAKLREGFKPVGLGGPGMGAIAAAGAEAVEEGAFQTYNAFQTAAYQLRGTEFEPDWTLYRPSRYQQPLPQVMIRDAAPSSPAQAEPQGEPLEVLVIPDRHNDPRHPHRLACTTWIARWGAERRVPIVVDLGDASTMDSCSRHDKNETTRGRLKPPIRADLENHEQALQTFDVAAGDWTPTKIKTRGNHEQRLWDFENQHPESEGTHTHAYAQALAQFGWRERGFGEIAYIEGVGFTHAPINGVGRPMGGKTSTHRAGALLTAPLVHGHTHQLQIYNDSKLGPVDRITVIQAGCALPWGEVEHYAMASPTGWWWGALILTLWGGQITSVEARSMLSLRNTYSDDGADVRAA